MYRIYRFAFRIAPIASNRLVWYAAGMVDMGLILLAVKHLRWI